MSRAWWLKTNTSNQLSDVAEWLKEQSLWTDISENSEFHRLIAKSKDTAITLICSDLAKHRPGSAAFAKEQIGTPATLTFTQELSKNIDHCGRLDEIYQFAFSFAVWDEKCNFYFELEDEGIFKRVDGTYTVNPDKFLAKSLSSMLTFPYVLADSDTRSDLLVSRDKSGD